MSRNDGKRNCMTDNQTEPAQDESDTSLLTVDARDDVEDTDLIKIGRLYWSFDGFDRTAEPFGGFQPRRSTPWHGDRSTSSPPQQCER
jgi:hypothetical protein